jgi:hypothetical protein
MYMTRKRNGKPIIRSDTVGTLHTISMVSQDRQLFLSRSARFLCRSVSDSFSSRYESFPKLNQVHKRQILSVHMTAASFSDKLLASFDRWLNKWRGAKFSHELPARDFVTSYSTLCGN